jgi:hypothetical protein
MLDVIKRVISGDDMNVTSNAQEGQQLHQLHQLQAHNVDTTTSNTGSESGLSTNFDTAPAVVENDMDIDQDVSGGAHFATSSNRSSLSDISEGHDTGLDIDGDDNMEDQLTMERGTLTRNDSKMSSDSNSVRGGSQNSSRDWGWFEDVHASEHAQAPQSKRRASNHRSSKKGKTRLVPLHSEDGDRETG